MFARPHELKGTSVVITGAASGIGRQLALDLFRRERASTILVDRDEGLLDGVRAELSSLSAGEGPAVDTIPCDVSDPESVAGLVTVLGDRPVDLLINSAGVYYAGSFERMDIAHFEHLVATNLMGTVRVTKALLPKLLASESGCVVNLSSLAGVIGTPGMCAYTTSKFGIVGFSEALRAELGDRIGVCTVCPSFVRTNIVTNAIIDDSVDDEARAQRINAMNAFLNKVGTSSSKVSRATIAAIKRRRKLTFVTPDARLLYALSRLLPTVSDAVVSIGYHKLLNRGVIEP
jgi:short-subunit dehydrogenase